MTLIDRRLNTKYMGARGRSEFLNPMNDSDFQGFGRGQSQVSVLHSAVMIIGQVYPISVYIGNPLVVVYHGLGCCPNIVRIQEGARPGGPMQHKYGILAGLPAISTQEGYCSR